VGQHPDGQRGPRQQHGLQLPQSAAARSLNNHFPVPSPVQLPASVNLSHRNESSPPIVRGRTYSMPVLELLLVIFSPLLPYEDDFRTDQSNVAEVLVFLFVSFLRICLFLFCNQRSWCMG